MNPSPRIGLLGCGVITQRILAGLLHILDETNATLVAVCDVVPSNLDAISEAIGSRHVDRFASLDDMLAKAELDAVLVATPIALHAQHVAAVLAAGCHVYTHKTLAPTAAECHALAAEAQRASLRLAASPGQILLPAYAQAHAVLNSGELGTLVSIDACTEAAPHRYEPERGHEDPPPGKPFSWEWYHLESKTGGPLDDMLVYPLAFLTEVFGSPSAAAVKGRLVTPAIEWRGRTVHADTPDAYAGLLMFGDVPATVRASFSANSSRVPWGMITLRGTKASMEIEKSNDLEYTLHITSNDGPARSEACPVWAPAAVAQMGSKECHVLTDIREFVNAIREQRDVAGATAVNAARVAEALALIKASAQRNGEWARVDKES